MGWVQNYQHRHDGGEPAKEVIEQERDTFTGLYNADGEPLHRQRKPIGFMRE